MNLTREEVIELLHSLDMPSVNERTLTRVLQSKINALPEMDRQERLMAKSPEMQDLLDDVLRSLADGKKVIVKPDPAEPAAKGPSGKVKAKAAGSKAVAKGGATATATAPKKAPRGVGVVATILECYQKASAKKPVTKEHILEVLVKRFPDRDPKGMKATVSASPYWIPKEKGLVVKKNDKGFWIEA